MTCSIAQISLSYWSDGRQSYDYWVPFLVFCRCCWWLKASVGDETIFPDCAGGYLRTWCYAGWFYGGRWGVARWLGCVWVTLLEPLWMRVLSSWSTSPPQPWSCSAVVLESPAFYLCSNHVPSHPCCGWCVRIQLRLSSGWSAGSLLVCIRGGRRCLGSNRSWPAWLYSECNWFPNHPKATKMPLRTLNNLIDWSIGRRGRAGDWCSN